MKKLILLSIFLFLLTGCVSVEPPKVIYLRTDIAGVSMQGAQLALVFNVENKNPFGLPVKGYSYNVFINDRGLLNETGAGFALNAMETKDLLIPVFVRYDRVIDNVLSIAANILANKMYLDIRVEGVMNAEALGFPVSVPFNASERVNIPSKI